MAVAEELADRLRDADVGVETGHRHIGRPILSGVAGGLLSDHELAVLRLSAGAAGNWRSPRTWGSVRRRWGACCTGHGSFSGPRLSRTLSLSVGRAVFWDSRTAEPLPPTPATLL